MDAETETCRRQTGLVLRLMHRKRPRWALTSAAVWGMRVTVSEYIRHASGVGGLARSIGYLSRNRTYDAGR